MNIPSTKVALRTVANPLIFLNEFVREYKCHLLKNTFV